MPSNRDMESATTSSQSSSPRSPSIHRTSPSGPSLCSLSSGSSSSTSSPGCMTPTSPALGSSALIASALFAVPQNPRHSRCLNTEHVIWLNETTNNGDNITWRVMAIDFFEKFCLFMPFLELYRDWTLASFADTRAAPLKWNLRDLYEFLNEWENDPEGRDYLQQEIAYLTLRVPTWARGSVRTRLRDISFVVDEDWDHLLQSPGGLERRTQLWWT